jgi:hypothetical protein
MKPTVYFLSLITMLMANAGLKAQEQKGGYYIELHPKFLKTNPTVQSFSWETVDSLTLHLKSGVTETYDFRITEQRKKFQDQYGDPPPYVPKHKSSGRVSRRQKIVTSPQ